MRRGTLAGLGLCALLEPGVAEAHLVNTRLGDFYGGVLHPLTGFDYLLPWLALAILAALQGAKAGRWLILMFPLGLLLGTMLSVALPGLGSVAFLNAIATAGLGILVASGEILPLPFFLAIGTLIGVAQGYDNGLAMAFDTDKLLFIGGVTAAGYAFAAIVTSLTIAFLDGHGGWRAIALRAGGSWIAAIGIMIVSLDLLRHTPG